MTGVIEKTWRVQGKSSSPHHGKGIIVVKHRIKEKSKSQIFISGDNYGIRLCLELNKGVIFILRSTGLPFVLVFFFVFTLSLFLYASFTNS